MTEDKKKKNDPQPHPSEEYWDPTIGPLCGSRSFEWGTIRDARLVSGPFDILGRVLNTRQCKRCGNVQLFAERPRS